MPTRRSAMKKLINHPANVVQEMMEGLLAAHSGLSRLSNYTVLLRSDAAAIRDRQVAVISGGGSGHEPAHAGFIGSGMLSAAVAGEVFTSPSSDTVYAAIKAITGKPGALLIVKNYTGDRLNFGLAAEIARADGLSVEIVIVADDIALAATHDIAGRRGIAGTILVHKIAGAAASEGKPLHEVAQIAREAAAAVATMGVSLSAGTVPAVGKPSFTLDDTEVELGLGIHGEPGVQRAPLHSADAITSRLLDEIVSVHRIAPGDEVVLMVNNLGSTTGMELAIVARRAMSELRSRHIAVRRVFAGTFMTSLEMAGVSLSLLRVDHERLRLLDAPTTAPAWPNASTEAPSTLEERTISLPLISPTPPDRPKTSEPSTAIEIAIEAACNGLTVAQERLTELDRMVGDGDLGITLARGAAAVLEGLPGYPVHHASQTLMAIGRTLQSVLGGASGPLYGVLFLRAGTALESKDARDPMAWAEAIQEANSAVSQLGGAGAGDRTMLDALLPFANTFREELGAGTSVQTALRTSVSAAEQGAEATAEMQPKRGRSSYLGGRAVGHPDPGAIAVALWLGAVAESLAQRQL